MGESARGLMLVVRKFRHVWKTQTNGCKELESFGYTHQYVWLRYLMSCFDVFLKILSVFSLKNVYKTDPMFENLALLLSLHIYITLLF